MFRFGNNNITFRSQVEDVKEIGNIKKDMYHRGWMLRFSDEERTKNTGEEKVKWVINQIEILKSKADKMVSSGIAESIHDALQEGPTDL